MKAIDHEMIGTTAFDIFGCTENHAGPRDMEEEWAEDKNGDVSKVM